MAGGVWIPKCLPGCTHWWIIERANGATSHGYCKYCHEEYEFLNGLPQLTKGGTINVIDREMGEARRAYYRNKLLPDPNQKIDTL